MTQMSTDIEPLYSSLGADPDLAEIVDLFVDEIPDRVSLLLEQLDASNWEGLRQTAHQLKGAAGSYGFSDVTPFAAEVEDGIKAQDPEDQIAESVRALANLCGRIRSGAAE